MLTRNLHRSPAADRESLSAKPVPCFGPGNGSVSRLRAEQVPTAFFAHGLLPMATATPADCARSTSSSGVRLKHFVAGPPARTAFRLPLVLALAVMAGLAGCREAGEGLSAGPGVQVSPAREIPGVKVLFDLSDEASFYDFPFPTDLRRATGEKGGRLDLSGYPRPSLELTRGLVNRYVQLAAASPGFSRSTTGYFRFEARVRTPNLPGRPWETVRDGLPVALVDVDPGSPEYGRRFPLLVRFYRKAGSFHPDNVLAYTLLPGVLLQPETTYAVMVDRALGDEQGEPLGSPLALQQLLRGQAPEGCKGGGAREVYLPLRDFLQAQGMAPDSVAAATVFTTGDPVGNTARIYDHVVSLPSLSPSIPLMRTREYETYTVLESSFRAPQFQAGEPPYLTGGGEMVFDSEGRPVAQRSEEIPFALAIPKGRMPAAGWPLTIYIHGTGGVSTQFLDRGRTPSLEEPPAEGTGPALTFAVRGLATAGAALPVGPQRGGLLEEGWDFYNVLQPPALRDNLRQGMAEQALFLRLLRNLRLDPGLCPGTDASLAPDGRIGFDPGLFFAMGQSLGSIVLDLWAACEEHLVAIIPSGTGGHFGTIAIEMRALPTADLLRVALAIPWNEELDLFHPFLNILMLAWGAADPVHFAGHYFRQPLPGRRPKHVYLSQGFFDSFFPPPCQNAFIQAAGLQLAGALYPEEGFEEIARQADYASPRCGFAVPCARSTLEVMEFLGLGVAQYPVTGNLRSADGAAVTAAVVQFLQDGILDGHHINFQLAETKLQYGTFLRTLIDTGMPVLVDPGRP